MSGTVSMNAFEAAAAAALDAEEKALKRDGFVLDKRRTDASNTDLLSWGTLLFSRKAVSRASNTLAFTETILAQTYTLDQCNDDFNSLLNQTIRTQTHLYHPGKPSDIAFRLERLFNILEFPIAQLLEKYTVDALLQSVYFIHINPTTQVREIHIRDLTSDEAAQFAREKQEILDLNLILIAREQAGVSAARTPAPATASAPVQPEHAASQS